MFKTRFFNGKEYSAADWAAYFSQIYSDGVLNKPKHDALKVVAADGMNATIVDGLILVKGYQLETQSERVTFEATTAAGRYDRVIVRLDFSTTPQDITLYIKKGTSTAPPDLLRNNQVHEMSLATVYLAPNTTVVSSAIITDDRHNSELCGVSLYYGNEMHNNPTGSVIAFAGKVAPQGWHICDGTPISRTTFSDLFALIGTTYGLGDGSTTFNLPDLRGEFIRGADNGRGVDAGRALGSHQEGTRFGYSTAYTSYISGGDLSQNKDTYYYGLYNPARSWPSIVTRPRNIALNYIIRY